MEDCLFCKIVKGEIPSKKIYEDEEILAFYDINPEAKKHIASLANIEKKDEELIGKIFGVINQISEEQGFKQEGYRVITNCGENGGQSIKHLHFHILAGKKLGEKIL